jgi:tartrate-resistant acid phosphatase type 5
VTLHWEEIAYVAGLGHDHAILAWGRFPIRLAGDRAEVVDQSDPDIPLERQQLGFVGRESPSWGSARLTVYAGDAPVASLATTDNHVVLRDLSPETAYRCELTIDGAPFAAHPRRLAFSPEGLVLGPAGPALPLQFRTFPAPDAPTPDFRFFVLGDPGSGVDVRPSSSAAQASVARAMATAAAQGPAVRFVLVAGDLIYARGKKAERMALLLFQTLLNLVQGNAAADISLDSGNEDDEWFSAFFEPYRELLASVPFFPALGNHDDGNEAGDDRLQLLDNLYLTERFAESGLSSWTGKLEAWSRGLFYGFTFGRDVRFAALDTTAQAHWAKLDANRQILDALFATGPRWILPFGHHPPFCLGPGHPYGGPDIRASRKHLWTEGRLRSPGVRASFWGHEHNLQHWQRVDHDLFVAGASGKFGRAPSVKKMERAAAKIVKYPHRPVPKTFATGPHFLDCRYDAARDVLTVTPVAGEGHTLGWLRPDDPASIEIGGG